MKTKTVVYLEPDQHRALKARARAEGISLAELIRRLTRVHVTGTDRLPVDRAVYTGLVALGASRRQSISDEHDAHLARALRRKNAR